MSQPLKNVIVCGIPGCGKTTYCEWLERGKGFIHLDFDKLLTGEGTHGKLLLVGLLQRSPEAFIAEVSSKQKPIVIDYGFPIESLGTVERLKRLGFEIWWFDGDREAALESFNRRCTVSTASFRKQMDSIEKNWNSIKSLVGNNMIDVVKGGPSHLSPALIFERMFGPPDECTSAQE